MVRFTLFVSNGWIPHPVTLTQAILLSGEPGAQRNGSDPHDVRVPKGVRYQAFYEPPPGIAATWPSIAP